MSATLPYSSRLRALVLLCLFLSGAAGFCLLSIAGGRLTVLAAAALYAFAGMIVLQLRGEIDHSDVCHDAFSKSIGHSTRGLKRGLFNVHPNKPQLLFGCGTSASHHRAKIAFSIFRNHYNGHRMNRLEAAFHRNTVCDMDVEGGLCGYCTTRN
jgi:hypothetical protein